MEKVIQLFSALTSEDPSALPPATAWRVPISRPFAVGQLTGTGWLYAENNALIFQGARPFPGPSFRVVHTDCDVEVQISRPLLVLIPWIAVDAILHDDDKAVVVSVPIWRKKRLLLLITQNGFT